MQTFQIKLAEHFDLPDIIEILEELNLDMEDLDEDDWMLAVVKEEIVGVGRLRYYDEICELSSVGVIEEFRNMGIGKAIIKALIDDASIKSIYTVTEIPEYFALSGFTPTDVFPEDIDLKLQRCRKELNCSSPQVLKLQLSFS